MRGSTKGPGICRGPSCLLANSLAKDPGYPGIGFARFHFGTPSKRGLPGVMLTGLLPSAFITQMSALFPMPRWNAISSPLGDQVGRESMPSPVVSTTRPVPSGAITTIDDLFPEHEAKTIFDPCRRRW